jgi:cyclase
MLTKRIIPCLDVKDGQTVKGINFVNLRQAGDPVELGQVYADQGADELVFLDITATVEQRRIFQDLVKRIARNLNIPFTVGGGIHTEDDVSRLLEAGADKITINTAAVKKPELIDRLAGRFGSQCIVVAIDTKNVEDQWLVYVNGGRTPTERITMDWADEVVQRGAGEILLTSMNHDGTKDGYALDITRKISQRVTVPVIASGGAGVNLHFLEVLTTGQADAALAASVFHFGEISIPELKKYLINNQVAVRL